MAWYTKVYDRPFESWVYPHATPAVWSTVLTALRYAPIPRGKKVKLANDTANSGNDFGEGRPYKHQIIWRTSQKIKKYQSKSPNPKLYEYLYENHNLIKTYRYEKNSYYYSVYLRQQHPATRTTTELRSFNFSISTGINPAIKWWFHSQFNWTSGSLRSTLP